MGGWVGVSGGICREEGAWLGCVVLGRCRICRGSR